MALAQESNGSFMAALGKSLLTFNRVDTFEEMAAKVEAVTPSQMLEVANRLYDPAQLCELRYLPTA